MNPERPHQSPILGDIYIVEEEFVRRWRYDVKYTDYERDIVYLRGRDACRLFDTNIYSARAREGQTIADVITEATGEAPRLYSRDEALEELERAYGYIADQEDIKARRYSPDRSRREGEPTPASAEGVFRIVSKKIETAPSLSLRILKGPPSTFRGFGPGMRDCNNGAPVTKYDVADGDVFLLRRTTLWGIVDDAISEFFEIHGPSYRLRPVRHRDDFLRQVVKKQEAVSRAEGSPSGKSRLSPNILLLYTDEDPQVASYVRTHFDELDKGSGDRCDIFFVENPASINPARHWKQFLETKAYVVWKLLGWADSAPYDKSQVYEIADSLGVPFDMLPCAVTFDGLPGREPEVTPLGNNLTEAFRSLLARYQSSAASPRSAAAALRVDDRQADEAQAPPVCFLSYSGRDRAPVREVAATLHSYGIETWFDEWEIAPGDRVLQKIADGLAKASAVAVFLSPHAATSRWVEEELYGALHRSLTTGRPRVIPVLLGDCEVPLLLANYHRIEAGDSPPAIAAAIRDAILGITDKPPVNA